MSTKMDSGELYTAGNGISGRRTCDETGRCVRFQPPIWMSTKTKKFPIPPRLGDWKVVSPTDVHYRIVRKALDYLEAGTRLVWVLDPIAKAVTVYRSKNDIETLTHEATLTGENVVPGFTCPVENLFE